ncbi:MAG: hypothetical protein PHX70_02990 [Clostridium sp.]|nr:hypothetical protein [Clostridium sp.]
MTNNKKIITIGHNQVNSILSDIFNKNINKRICVVGTTCCGKSYLINKLNNCRDMDDEIFPLLSNEEKKYATS